MKRILFVAPSLRPGGMEKMLATVANCLAAQGNSVTVLILDDITDLRDELSQSVRLLHKPYKSHFGQKLPFIRHKLYDAGMWESRVSAQKLHSYYTDNEKYDVEIAFFRGLSVKIVSGCTDSDTVRLAWVHNDFRKAIGYLNNFKDIQDVYHAYAKFNRVVCVSEQARQGFIETIGDTGNTQTIYNIIPVEKIRQLSEEEPLVQTPEGTLNLVIVARLENRAKGQQRLIEAVSRLRGEGEKVTLTVVGGGADEALLREEIEKHRAEEYILLTGEQSNPYPYIRQADLLVCASYYEGYNLTVAEALILGTPVLSTDCTGPDEILDHGKYGMIVANSGEGLYNGLKSVYETPGLLQKYREKAKQRIDFFDEAKLLKQITDLFSLPERREK